MGRTSTKGGQSVAFSLPPMKDTGGPKYVQFRHSVVDALRGGTLKPGDPIPSEQQLAELFEFSRTTVRQAMADLEQEGLIRRVQGKGTFIHEEASNRLKKRLAVFGLIVPSTDEGSYPSLLEGFQKEAGSGHRQVIVCSTHNSMASQSDAILQLLDKGVDGVAILPSSQSPTPAYQIREIQKQGVPVVFCHRGVEGIRAPKLLIPYRKVGSMVGSSFLEYGHRRVALFIHRPGDASVEYEAGLGTVLRAAGSDLDEALIYRGSKDTPDLADQEPAITQALERMLSLPDPPTAIMASFDSVGELVYLLLHRLGVKTPEDVSLLSFGGTNRNSPILRRLGCVSVDEGCVGQRAAAYLAEITDGKRVLDDEEVSIMPLSHYQGATLGQAPGTGGSKSQ